MKTLLDIENHYLLELMQPRLDKVGDSLEDFLDKLRKMKIHPPELTRGAEQYCKFLKAMGVSQVCQLVQRVYPTNSDIRFFKPSELYKNE